MGRYKLERALAAWVGATILAVVQSCEPLTGSACSLRPCVDGLVVEVTGDTSQVPLDVEATTPGGARLTEPCVFQGEYCQARFHPGFTPEQATIRIMGTSDTTIRTVRPEYTVSYPNGASCGPVCRTATVRIAQGPSGGRSSQ